MRAFLVDHGEVPRRRRDEAREAVAERDARLVAEERSAEQPGASA